jgi:hypothetical protein
MFREIVFMQDSEGSEVVDKLVRASGTTSYGATDQTIAECIEYLSQWDNGVDGEIVEDLGVGSLDEIVERDGYILNWHVGLGYVGLAQRI